MVMQTSGETKRHGPVRKGKGARRFFPDPEDRRIGHRKCQSDRSDELHRHTSHGL